MITLALEASTYAGSVCVARGRAVVASRDVAMRDAQSEQLMPAVVAVLDNAQIGVRDVHRIICGAGPGSFTSLRIAAAIAKGLAMATDRPLYAVSSLALMLGSIHPKPSPGEYVAVLDALRGEMYAAACVVDDRGEVTDVGPVRLIDADLEAVEDTGQVVVGESGRIRGTPHARGVVRVSPILDRQGPVNLDRWEPDYGRVAEAQRRWEAAHGRALPRV
jgi:tRNA threonylcarbamoyladenosine biosynthesis protein TsaB